jgi:hypothetical protein
MSNASPPQMPDVVQRGTVVLAAALTVAVFVAAGFASLAVLASERGAPLHAGPTATPLDRPLLLHAQAPPFVRPSGGFRWIDRDAGVVGLPLDVAAAVVVERGPSASTPEAP